MRYELKIILATLLTGFMAIQSFGNTPADSVKVYFRAGYSRFDPSFDNNRKAMESFINIVKEKHEADEIDSIVVRGYSSPEGVSVSNERLSLLRCRNIADLIVKDADINPQLIRMVPEGVAWKELRRIVADDPEVPSREKILYILDNVPLWIRNAKGAITDGRKKRLMELDRGETFRWLYANVFPQLRNAVAIALYFKPGNPDSEYITEKSLQSETTILEDIPDIPHLTETSEKSVMHDLPDLYETSEMSYPSNSGEQERHQNFESVHHSKIKRQPLPFAMGIKSNLLYDALLVPNIGAEFRLGRHLSIYGEWMYAWWDRNARHRYWRVYGGDIGLRWWFGGKSQVRALSGHHLGLYGGILTFDFELGDNGYMGGKPGGTLWDRWIMNSGIEYGYSLPVGRRLNIDFSIGIGYLGGHYIKYYPFDNDYYYDKEYRMRYFGPTKAEISLVWIIGRMANRNWKGGEE